VVGKSGVLEHKSSNVSETRYDRANVTTYGGPIGSHQRSFDFWGRRHISTSGFVSTATETAVFALFLPVQSCSNR